MRIRRTPRAVPWTGLPGSPSSLNLSPSLQGPAYQQPAQTQALPSPHAGEGEKGGGLSLRNGQECGSPVSAGSIPGSRAQPPPPCLGDPPHSPPPTPEPSPALTVEGLRELGRRRPDPILPQWGHKASALV